MNLIPTQTCDTGNYWCTWCTQATTLTPTKLKNDVKNIRNNLDEKTLFEFISFIPQKVRGDIYVSLDDGWDVPYDTINPDHYQRFGSLVLNEDRFPSFSGDPAERLKKLNNAIKALGFKGTGLWISPQRVGECSDLHYTLEESVQYWEECAKRCAIAGIAYWKVDWGSHCNDIEYLNMMTRVVRKYAPKLKIEHAYVQWPSSPKTEEKKNIHREASVQIASICDYFRTYDDISELTVPITLGRVAELLSSDFTMKYDSLGIINVEDSPYMAAALGCSSGIMRHNQMCWKNTSANKRCLKADEVERCLMWHRIAPPFGMKNSEALISDKILTDSHYFDTDPSIWPYIGGTTVKESAPACFARGTQMPEIHPVDKDIPYVVCAKNPNTGAYSIATLMRDGKTPLADISVHLDNSSELIGIFGKYHTLTFTFDDIPENVSVYMQDLRSETAIDVTNEVCISKKSIIISGDTIEKYGAFVKSENDISDPGLVMRVI